MSREDFIALRAANKRAAILVAAAHRFAVDGYDRASTASIARDANVSTATLFRQFPNKLDLFANVLSDTVSVFRTALLASAASSPRENLASLVHAYAALLDQPRTAGLMRAVLAAVPVYPDVAAAFYDSTKMVIVAAFHQPIIALEASGDLIFPDGPELAVGQLMGMIEHFTLWRRLLSTDTAPFEITARADLALETFFCAWSVRTPSS